MIGLVVTTSSAKDFCSCVTATYSGPLEFQDSNLRRACHPDLPLGGRCDKGRTQRRVCDRISYFTLVKASRRGPIIECVRPRRPPTLQPSALYCTTPARQPTEVIDGGDALDCPTVRRMTNRGTGWRHGYEGDGLGVCLERSLMSHDDGAVTQTTGDSVGSISRKAVGL